MAASKPEKAPILSEKTPSVKYSKRYDQVSWRSADTDFEPEPSLGNGVIHVQKGKYSFCTKRNRKLSALIIVVVIFLIIMGALIYLYYSKPGVVNSTTVVTTDCGKLTGLIMSVPYLNDIYQLNVFKGIPYALPPLGPLRWSAPKPVSESNCWEGVFTAYKYASKCAQGEYEGSEDCLYLNVFTPKLSDDANLPVFVWIHGGYLMTGSGNDFGYSPNMEFAIMANSIVVTINYRLNAFGFLTLEELWQKDVSYANFGLMDQILALKWIQKNIKKFGGDPNSVTLCGHNSGGTSIFALLVSPQADGLFHKVISMSGFPKLEMSYQVAAKQNRLFINRTRCRNLTNFHNIRTCLYNLTTTEILDGNFLNVYNGFIKQNLLDFPMKGEMDDGLLVIDPLVVVTSPNKIHQISQTLKNKVSILIGSTAQEIGVSPTITFNGDKQLINFKHHLTKYLDTFSSNLTDVILGKLYKNITMIENVSNEYNAEYLHESITSDVRVNCPTNALFKSLMKSTNHRAYRYVVTYRPSQPVPMYNHQARFAFHMWDQIALFNFELVQKNFIPNNNDQKFQKNLQQNFKHFMLFGHMESSDWVKGVTASFNQNGDVVVSPLEYHEKQCSYWNDPSNGFVPYAWSD